MDLSVDDQCAQFARKIWQDQDRQRIAWVRLRSSGAQRDFLLFPKPCKRFQFFGRRALVRELPDSSNNDVILDSVLSVLMLNGELTDGNGTRECVHMCNSYVEAQQDQWRDVDLVNLPHYQLRLLTQPIH